MGKLPPLNSFTWSKFSIGTMYLDMDGVIVNLQEAIKDLGEEERRRIFATDVNFWRTVPKFPWSDRLVTAVLGGPWTTYILTSPGRNKAAAATGKILWLQEHYPHFTDEGRVVITTRKELLSKCGTCLIDDEVEQVNNFYYGGDGVSIKFNPWDNHEKVIEWLEKKEL